MIDVTYVVVSRNDTYDPDNINKLVLTINSNNQQLLDEGLTLETLFIDWCSAVPFHTLDRIKNEIKVPVKHIYVDKSIPASDGLDTNRYYEFFAKNIGMRRASGKYVLIENSDCLNDDDLAKSTAKMVKDGLTNVYGRPTARVNVWYPNIDEYTHYDTINDKPHGDLNPGDFMLMTKEDWINKAQGYDEVNPCHRGPFWQTHMDVEVLFQMVLKGMSPHFLEGYYRHMDHGRTSLSHREKYGNSQRNCGGYVNRPNWGFIDANSKEENGIITLSK